MKSSVGGLVELGCGWWVAVGASRPGEIRLVFDPAGQMGAEVFVLQLSMAEGAELVEAIEQALRRAR